MEFTHAQDRVEVDTPAGTTGPSKLSDDVLGTNLKVDQDIPITLYESRFGKPYAADVFKVSDKPTMMREKGTMERLQSIESYVLEGLKAQGLSDSKESYNKFLHDLMSEIGIHNNTQPAIKISKVYAFLALDKMRSNPEMFDILKRWIG